MENVDSLPAWFILDKIAAKDGGLQKSGSRIGFILILRVAVVIAQWISQQGFRVYEAFEEFQRNKKKTEMH